MDGVTHTDTPVLWAGLLAGPVAWVIHLQGAFALSAWATEHGNTVPLHLLGAACLLVALGGGVFAWRAWRTVDAAASAARRARYMAVVGTMAGVLFAVVITAQWLAVVMLPHTMGAG